MKWFSEFLTKSQKKVISDQVLSNVDGKIIEIGKGEILLIAILRNESLRLPYFLEYYKSLGVDKFFFVDNNSSDMSREIILKEPKAHLFFTAESYTNHWYWMEYLLEMYGKGHWCLVVDIDELFSYPNSNLVTLPSLIEYFEQNNFTSFSSILLDMYSSEEVNDCKISCKSNPMESLQFFDIDYYKVPFTFIDRKNNLPIYIHAYTGGMRERVFGKMNPLDILTKIPLFKFEKDIYLVQGMHAISNTKPADIEGVVFHTKFLHDFIEEVLEESERGEHWNNAIRYKHYKDTISVLPKLNLHCEHSIKYENNTQLVELGIIKTSPEFEKYCNRFKS
ncbi:MAG: glycosyltransferase family 2 protein [Leadbetterella sp.]|nr:glycosyltransferase family 2 protein [Leadbetterella sp.]